MRPASARQAVDEGRGTRTPLFLRIGVGGCVRATDSLVLVEGAPAFARGRWNQASDLCRHPRSRGKHGATRTAPSHSADRSGRVGRLGLISAWQDAAESTNT